MNDGLSDELAFELLEGMIKGLSEHEEHIDKILKDASNLREDMMNKIKDLDYQITQAVVKS